MIVTTGKHIKVEVSGFLFQRTAETPGLVRVTTVGSTWKGDLELPANLEEMQRIIEAYERVCAEEVDYRKSEVE